MNTFKILKIASEINGMTSDELQVLAECLNESTGEKLLDFISFDLQNRDLLNIEVQESVC
jgi:hypothetical protein